MLCPKQLWIPMIHTASLKGNLKPKERTISELIKAAAEWTAWSTALQPCSELYLSQPLQLCISPSSPWHYHTLVSQRGVREHIFSSSEKKVIRNSVLRCWLGKMTQKWHQSMADSLVELQTIWAKMWKWRCLLKSSQRDCQHRNTQTSSCECLGRSSATCQAWGNPVWETSSVTGTYLCCRAGEKAFSSC